MNYNNTELMSLTGLRFFVAASVLLAHGFLILFETNNYLEDLKQIMGSFSAFGMTLFLF